MNVCPPPMSMRCDQMSRFLAGRWHCLKTLRPNGSHPGIAVLCADGGQEDVCVKLTVNQDAAGPCEDDLDSEAGSEVLDPGLLEEMLARMEDDGDDARAAARHAPLAPKPSFS